MLSSVMPKPGRAKLHLIGANRGCALLYLPIGSADSVESFARTWMPALAYTRSADRLKRLRDRGQQAVTSGLVLLSGI